MDRRTQRRLGWSVEFVDDVRDVPDPDGSEGRKRRWRWLEAVHPPPWVSLAVSGVMSTAAVITIVSVFLTQLTFHLFAIGHEDSTYAVDGLGRYRALTHGSRRFVLEGHAPAFGAVTIVGAVALLLSAALALRGKRGALASALSAGVGCTAAGVIAATFACEALEGAGFPKHAWGAGFWLLLTGASLAGLAALVGAALAGVDPRSRGRSGPDRAT